MCVCVCLYVCTRERERESAGVFMAESVCRGVIERVCVFVIERDIESCNQSDGCGLTAFY